MRFLAVLLVAVTLAGCADTSSSESDPAGDPADSAPAVDDVSTAGADRPIVEVASAEALVDDLDTLDADTVVLNFWATWCGPCRLEFPEFIRYDQEMADEGIHVRFVSLDQPVDLPLVQSFLAEHDVADPSYLYTGQGDVTRQLNPFVGGAIPITMILDGEGIVQHTHVGQLTYADLVQTVETVRAGGDPSASSS